MTVNIDWENLGFFLYETTLPLHRSFQNSQWSEGQLTEDAELHISESSPALHYGQQAFEGLKAYRTKDGKLQLFRPDQNAERLQRTADRLLMEPVPTDLFIKACKEVVKANADYVPPYGTGGTLYLRPLLIGVGDIIGVKPAEEYIFTVLPCRLVTISKAAWLRPTSSSKTSTTVRHQMEQGQPRLVVTTRRRSYRANMPKAGLLRCHLPGSSYPHQD